MKTALFLSTLILLLSACTPQLAAAPTSTPTPVPSPIATATKTPTETVVPTVSPELNPTDTVASVLKAPIEPQYDTTEFTGIYSEKYYPDRFRYTFTYQDELGTEFTIHLGLTSGLPRSAAIPSEKGKKYLAGVWLRSCYSTYTQIMGNEISLEEYQELISQGGGQVEHTYFDELTGEIKESLMDPTKGSFVITSNDKLLLQANENTNYYQESYYITANQDRVIIIAGFDPDVIEEINRNIKKSGLNPDFEWSLRLMNRFSLAMRYLGGLTPEIFLKGGKLDTNRMELFNLYDELVYVPEFDKIDPKRENKTSFMSVN